MSCSLSKKVERMEAKERGFFTEGKEPKGNEGKRRG